MSEPTAAEEALAEDRMLDRQIAQHEEDVALKKTILMLTEAATRLKRLTPSDEELADAVGHCRQVEVMLSKTRRRWESLTAEMERQWDAPTDNRADPQERAGAPVAVGKDFELVPTFETKRTYNTPAILMAVAEETEVFPMDVLQDAIAADAVRLAWRWTDLKKWLSRNGVGLSTVPRPVTDHDGTDEAMVGEDKQQTGVTRVALKGE
jgi:hypothetical protein